MNSFRPALTAALLAVCLLSRAQGLGGGNVAASLLAETLTVQPGKPAAIALRLKHNDHFHTYWVNPGDVGSLTKVDWTLPEGWTAGAFAWPAPQRLLQDGLVNLVHEGDLLLPLELTPPAGAPEGTVEIKGKAKWLECSDTCIPGKADLTLRLEVRNAPPAPDPAVAALFAAARARLPVTPKGYVFTAARAGTDFVLTVRPPEGVAELAKPDFFPVTRNAVSLTNAFPWVKGEAGYTLTLPMEEDAPEVMEAVLVPSAPWPGVTGESVAVKVTLGAPAPADATATVPAPAPAAGAPVPAPAATPVTLVLLAGAFLGGLILNLMPCVFPVISLKVMGFVQQAHGDARKAMKHGLVFSLGVLLSFWAFAALILALKAAGGSVGWGFQFQDYRMPIGMSFLFTLLALNFFGVFEVGQSLTGVGAGAQAKEGYSGSFSSGVLAVLVATPCTGPFLGTAIGAALNQPGAVTVVIFTLLGLGMSLPYLILGAFPSLLRFVPRPGEWMNTFKQVLGFLMLATTVFMMYILGSQKPAAALVHLFGGLLLAGFGAWIYGRWGGLERTRGQRGLALAAGLLCLAAGVVAALSFPEARGLDKVAPAELAAIEARGYAHYKDFSPEARAELAKRGVAIHWQPWDPARVEELHRAGKPVFIDFTASWCAICQQNKGTTFHRAEVEKAFAAKGVVTMLADFSNEDDRILRELGKYGRAGVPLYLLYGRDPARPPEVLPNVLSPGIVLSALEKL